jgi:AraC family transcriptional regulator of adaptative response/methylated-DNA-[protein]-cysteine methyltransferase
MTDYERIAEAIRYISSNVGGQPSLEQVANHLNLSKFHFQRLFTRWVGTSPNRFLQSLTVEYAKALLKESSSIDKVSDELGLSSTSRLHDQFINLEAMTPGEYKTKGKGLTINYGFHETPFGYAFIAITDRGICQLSFLDKNDNEQYLNQLTELEKKWQFACITESKEITKPYISSIFEKECKQPELVLHVQGTNFQTNVWKALLKIPYGKLTTYGQLANSIAKPKASRAVGTAVGANPIAFLIPCHRVIRATGIIGEYRWGKVRKQCILAWEASKIAN